MSSAKAKYHSWVRFNLTDIYQKVHIRTFQSLIGTVQQKFNIIADSFMFLVFQSLIGTVQRVEKPNLMEGNDPELNALYKVSISHRYGSTLEQPEHR